MRHSFLYCLPFFLCGGLIYLYRDEIVNLVKAKKVASIICCITLTVLYLVTPDELLSTDIIVLKTLLLYASWLFVALGVDSVVLSNSFTTYISGISMEMYLAHMVVFRIIDKLHLSSVFGHGVLDYMVTYFWVVVLLIVGIAIYRKMESSVRLKIFAK